MDQEIATIFTYFAQDEDYDFARVKSILADTNKNVQVAIENYAINNINQIYAYINMRREQVEILEEIVANLKGEEFTV